MRLTLGCKLGGIIVYGVKAHTITRRVIPAHGNDLTSRVTQHQRTKRLLQRIGGTMLLLQSVHWDMLQRKFLVKFVFEDANRLQLRDRLRSAEFENLIARVARSPASPSPEASRTFCFLNKRGKRTS